ncbi:SDR family oxidoreductase [Actinoplanes sp. NPDC051411]|jgi:3-oxoacyl-[acyl-carrier protein] reductase|uniref:SDR family NAD(P)-dependent oxidoreductase n=1 Tax=Actinoplanes sp. NPDC051411 TaxID=3155522 RepID=UPI00342BE191
MTLTGKIALVTGGTRGIGRAIVERLTSEGAQVYFTYRARTDAASDVAERTGATPIQADQSSLAAVDAMFAPLPGRLDILVNNAAANGHLPLADLTGESFDRMMTVNTKVPLLAIQRAAPLMPRGGRVINLSTLNTAVPAPGLTLYCATKAALEQITAVLARELGPHGITVNTVSPGATDTDLLRTTNPPDALPRTAALTALQRLGNPSDIASVVAFLCTEDAGWLTGQNLRATGGLLI